MRLSFTVVASLLLLSACASPRLVAPTSPSEVGEIHKGSGYLNGYLSPGELPDSLALLPPPPSEGSAALNNDIAAFRELTKFQGTPRGAMAVADANLQFPAAPAIFTCALGFPISEQATPNLNMLLWRSMTDTAVATAKAKDKYVRVRPFVMLKTQSCTPNEEASLAKDGSYPSGHAAIGWGWALLLAEVAPNRSDALLQRGRAFSQSRGICGVHWQSDIEAGRLMGAATVARLHNSPVFQAQITAAREEVKKAQALTANQPIAGCDAETAAMGSSRNVPP